MNNPSNPRSIEREPITDLAQLMNVGIVNGEKNVTPGMDILCRAASAESAVLLKNNGVLPLKKESPTAYFGRCQNDWFYIGYGSGGDINPPYRVSPMQALEESGAAVDAELASLYHTWCNLPENSTECHVWGGWPRFYPEMPLTMSQVESAASRCDAAVVFIGRAAGEDRENLLEKGSYYLTDDEHTLLDMVTAAFHQVIVVLNIGNMMDFAWVEEYGERISALLLAWQCGMESGHGLVDVLYGSVSPSGLLPDTIARHYEDYPSSTCFGNPDSNEYEEDIYVGYRWFDTFAPDAVLYPFGFGLSYTDFSLNAGCVEKKDDSVQVSVRVTNTGSCAGKKVVLLWCSAPEGLLDRPKKVLAAFEKTPLLAPGETAELTLTASLRDLASFDDVAEAWILEKGSYPFAVCEADAGSFVLEESITLKEVEEICISSPALRERILDRLPPELPQTGDKGIRLSQVYHGDASLDAFIAQLTDEELEAISRGQGPMDSEYGPEGNAGAFGGITESLRAKGIPAVITTDGPSGIRLKQYCSLLPCGTALSASFNTALVEKLYALLGKEMILRGTDVLLAPGMNIHRNPLCGRNFEYYSEDPLHSGKMASATVRGIQSQGVSACIKHFACNNQETNRNRSDSVVTERALREIYLRGFEIAIKDASPNLLMTSYNKVNGVWSHYNYDLAVTVLRKEWGFEGLVITDWWMQYAPSPEFPSIRDNAYRVRAGVDVLMPGSICFQDNIMPPDTALLASLGTETGITRGELQLVARHVLQMILRHIPISRYEG